jgi:hypothetical protein
MPGVGATIGGMADVAAAAGTGAGAAPALLAERLVAVTPPTAGTSRDVEGPVGNGGFPPTPLAAGVAVWDSAEATGATVGGVEEEPP